MIVRSAPMSFAPHCAQCLQPISGKILTHSRANCCEKCFARLHGNKTLQQVEAEARDLAAARAKEAAERTRLLEYNFGPQPQRRHYKRLTAQDGFFSGRFDFAKLESAINHYAAEGWVVRSMATANVPGGLPAHRDELIVLLEREFRHELPDWSIWEE